MNITKLRAAFAMAADDAKIRVCGSGTYVDEVHIDRRYVASSGDTSEVVTLILTDANNDEK